MFDHGVQLAHAIVNNSRHRSVYIRSKCVDLKQIETVAHWQEVCNCKVRGSYTRCAAQITA